MFLWPSVFLRPLKGKCWKRHVGRPQDPKRPHWTMKRYSLLPKEIAVGEGRIWSNVLKFLMGNNTRRTDPFKKKIWFWLCQPCWFPKPACDVCKAAGLVCNEWGLRGIEFRPCFNLAWTHTHSYHSPVWYHQVLARASEQTRGLRGSKERGKVGEGSITCLLQWLLR